MKCTYGIQYLQWLLNGFCCFILFYFIGVCSVAEELNDGCRWHGTMDTRENCVEKSALSTFYVAFRRLLLLIVADVKLHISTFLLFQRSVHGKKHISKFIFSHVIISVWSDQDLFVLKILEIEVKFKAPAPNSEEWPLIIRNERNGELTAHFANG